MTSSSKEIVQRSSSVRSRSSEWDIISQTELDSSAQGDRLIVTFLIETLYF